MTDIVNVYNKSVVREAISKSLETAEEDENVKSIEIASKYTGTTTIDKEEFAELIRNDIDSEDEETHTDKTEDVDTCLVITSLSFETGNNWSFLFNGFNIKMRIKDSALMNAIDNGERFGKGDSIRVKMQITKRYNQTFRAYEKHIL